MSNRPATPTEGATLNIGGSDEKRRKLQQERQREYNQLLAQVGHCMKYIRGSTQLAVIFALFYILRV